MILQRIDPGSCGKVLGSLYAVLGFLFGVFVSLVSLVGAVAPRVDFQGMVVPSVLGLGALIIFPVVYGLIGWILGMIGAALYNVVASFVGGIEIDIRGPHVA